MVQDARIQRVFEFLKAPSQLSDKDLASKVCSCVFVHPPYATIKLSTGGFLGSDVSLMLAICR